MQTGSIVMKPFDLEKFTYRREILKYSENLLDIYSHVEKIFTSEESKVSSEESKDSFLVNLKNKIVDDENWLLKIIQTTRNVKQGVYNPHILNGLFLKVYGAQNECENWPPLTYPPSAPLLVYVPGIHGESNQEWFMRILHMIGGKKTHVDWKADTRGYPARHIYENAWLSDTYIKVAFDQIKSALREGVPYEKILDGSSESIIDGYTRDGEVVGDVIHSKMNTAQRFFKNLEGYKTIGDMFTNVGRPVTEFDVTFITKAIGTSKLSRTELPWAQQLFIITHPANTLYTLTGSLPAADTVWIADAKRKGDEYGVIQGAYMPGSPEFLDIYYMGIADVSKKLLEKLQGQESLEELKARISKTSKHNPSLSVKQVLDIVDATPFTLDGKKPLKSQGKNIGNAYQGSPKTNKGDVAVLNVRGDMLAANLRNLRRHTFKTPAWHFWKKSAKAKIGEIIKKYGLLGPVGLDVQKAALALQSRHTEANKEELIRALEHAVRKQRATYKHKSADVLKRIPVESDHVDILPADILAEDLREYMLIKNDAGRILEEMKRSWLFNKSKKLIKELQNKYLERFEIKAGYRNVGKPVLLHSEQRPNLNLDGPGKSALDVEILMALRDLKNEQTLKTLIRRIEAAIGHNEKMFRLSMKVEGRMNSDAILNGILLKQATEKHEVRIPKRATLISGRPGRKPDDKIRPRASPPQPVPAISPQPVPAISPQPVSAVPLPILTTESPVQGIPFTTPVTSGVQNINLVSTPKQVGGWSPSLMTSFAVNGMRLLPVAGYMGYNMLKNRNTMKRRGKTRGTRRQP